MTGGGAGYPVADAGLVILGTSGHAREVVAIAGAAGGPKLLGCVGPHRVPDIDRLPVPWIGVDDWLGTADAGISYVIGIGSGEVRMRLDQSIRATGRPAARLVHPAAVLAAGVELGDGSVLWPGAVLMADVRLGRHVHVNSNVAVGHDTVLEDYATLLPGCTVAGSARIGRAATIGAGATVIDGIKVGAGAMIGAGAAVVRDVPDGAVVAGVPARQLGPAVRSAPSIRSPRHRGEP